MDIMKRAGAEFLGTFWLVFGGLFWFAPIAGALIAGYVYRLVWEKKKR
jgi:glycerol uptake facilitator-like aquaporin